VNHEQPKGPRKLQMLPEVLPAPSPSDATSDVRGRTVAHMQRLLAAATAVAASGCSHEASSSNTVTIPVASNASTAPTSTVPPLHTAATVATATPVHTAEPDVGYAVVDPMPAPARCLGLAPASRTTAVLRRDGANGVILDVSLTLATTGSWQGSAFDTSSPPSPWGGQILSTSFKGASVVVRIKPTVPAGSTATSTSVGVSFPISCAAGSGNVSVTATVPLPLKDGTKPTLHVADY
jgi:hypothetical protein